MRVALRLQPKASRDRIDGLAARSDGAVVLKARVGAPPEEGRANAAAIALLAKAWGVAKSDIRVLSGATARDKILHIAGEPSALLSRLETWRAKLERP